MNKNCKFKENILQPELLEASKAEQEACKIKIRQ